MQPHRKRFAIAEQLDLFRPQPVRLQWEALPNGVKKQVATLLAQLIVDTALRHLPSDQKELIDE